MTEFNQFKESIIDVFTEMDTEYFLDEGEHLYQEEIAQLYRVTNFTDMAKILIDCEYWDMEDAIMYGRVVKEYTLVNN